MAVFGNQANTWRDAGGYTARTNMAFTAATAAALDSLGTAWTSALAACTNAVPVSGSGLNNFRSTSPSYGTDSTYVTINHKLVLIMMGTSSGRLHRFSIPSPILANFEVDQYTAALSSTALAALITIIVANACSNDEVHEQFSVLSGHYKLTRKKFTINPYSLGVIASEPEG